MKIGIDSYCFHRYFGEVYDNQQDPGRRITYEDFLIEQLSLALRVFHWRHVSLTVWTRAI